MSKSEQLVGAYSAYSCKISSDAESAFKEAFEGFVGVRYSPVAVSEQLVSGTNYKFFCNSTMVTQYPVNGAAVVCIYKPLNGTAHITSIQPIH